jgi:hypothetical protein
MSSDYALWVMLVVGLLGIVGLIVWLGILSANNNKDNASDIQKNLGIIASITAILVGLFGGAAYIYFSANVNYLSPFLLILGFVNMFLGVFATSVSTFGIVYA